MQHYEHSCSCCDAVLPVDLLQEAMIKPYLQRLKQQLGLTTPSPTDREVSVTVEHDTEPRTVDGDIAGTPVTAVNGIGPARSEQLAAAGITTVAELAAADSSDLADQTDMGVTLLDRLIDRAGEAYSPVTESG